MGGPSADITVAIAFDASPCTTAKTLALTETPAAPLAQPASPPRLLSVDIYRGLAVAAMLLVDYQGNEAAAYSALKHAAWNGWTAADLVFPSFLFLVGVSVALSLTTRLQRGQTRGQILRHAVGRAAMLIALGVLLNGVPTFDLHSWRVLGVIQRIGLCYLAAVALGLWFRSRGQTLIFIACLLGYWALLRLVPVPGHGMPGSDVPFLDPAGNLTSFIDRTLFPGRLYHGDRDPEGLLSTLPAIASTLAGLLAGRWLLCGDRSRRMRAAGLALLGGVLLTTGLLWGLWFPLNKNLWTSSYVCLAAGFSLLVLAALYCLVEIRHHRGWWTVPFLVFGLNALLAFVLDALVWLPPRYLQVRGASGMPVPLKKAVNDWLLLHLPAAPASLAYAALITLACWLLLYPLYRKRWFVKL